MEILTSECLNTGKIESAIASAFYPGTYPFAHGGFAKVAGALCFYLVKAHAFLDGNKRTGALAAITFLNMHGLDVEYPVDIEKGIFSSLKLPLKVNMSLWIRMDTPLM